MFSSLITLTWRHIFIQLNDTDFLFSFLLPQPLCVPSHSRTSASSHPHKHLSLLPRPPTLFSQGADPLARPQEVGRGVRPVHVAAPVAGSLQRHQCDLLPAAGPAVCHHHLPHLQVRRPGCAEVQRGSPLQVRGLQESREIFKRVLVRSG